MLSNQASWALPQGFRPGIDLVHKSNKKDLEDGKGGRTRESRSAQVGWGLGEKLIVKERKNIQEITREEKGETENEKERSQK